MKCKICSGVISEDKGVVFPGARTYTRPCKSCSRMHGINGEPLIAKIEVDGVPLSAYIYWGSNGYGIEFFFLSQAVEAKRKER